MSVMLICVSHQKEAAGWAYAQIFGFLADFWLADQSRCRQTGRGHVGTPRGKSSLCRGVDNAPNRNQAGDDDAFGSLLVIILAPSRYWIASVG